MRAYASARHPGFARLAASGIGAIHVLGKPHRESQGDDDGYVERRRSEPSELDKRLRIAGAAAAAPVRKSTMMMMMMDDMPFCWGQFNVGRYIRRAEAVLRCPTGVAHVPCWGGGMSASRIEWTEVTWNPTTGCDRISPWCDHCYAMTIAKRLKAMGSPKYQNDGDPRTSGPGFGVTMHSDSVLEPILKWPRNSRIAFLDSMSDVFHACVTARILGQIFATMALTPQHTYQILTKRPNRMRGRAGAARDAGNAAQPSPRRPGVACSGDAHAGRSGREVSLAPS